MVADEARHCKDSYNRVAERYDATRDRSLFEKAWLDRALADVSPGGAVLDLGCGAGEPIGRYLCTQGYALTGCDFSPAMLALFAACCPTAQVVEADMRQLDLRQRFEAIIGWGSVFHLTQAEQRAALPRIAAHLAPGGRVLLTVGHRAGETTGMAGGERVFHASLAPESYRAILRDSGCETEAFVPEDPQARGHTMLLARKTG